MVSVRSIKSLDVDVTDDGILNQTDDPLLFEFDGPGFLEDVYLQLFWKPSFGVVIELEEVYGIWSLQLMRKGSDNGDLHDIVFEDGEDTFQGNEVVLAYGNMFVPMRIPEVDEREGTSWRTVQKVKLKNIPVRPGDRIYWFAKTMSSFMMMTVRGTIELNYTQ